MTVLIVEDDPMVAQINRKFAAKLPFVEEVEVVSSPGEAREILEEREFDLLLLDVYFPRGRGPELLQWIRTRNLPVHVIFITADNSQATVERALHLGVLDYLVKPFTFERFRDALEDADRRMGEMTRGDSYDQDVLDRIFKSSEKKDPSQETGTPDLDKGMSYKTYDTVREKVMETTEPFTAEQIGERLGIARVTIRRYLDFLARQGVLDVELRYGKIGRPQHFYRFKGHR